AGAQTLDPRSQVREHWRQTTPGDFDPAWADWLRRGTIPNTAATMTTVTLRADFATALPKPAAAPGFTVLLRPDPFLRDGAQANNGWLQELPRPLTRLVWDNAALIAPATAKRLSIASEDVVEIAAGGSVRVPALVLPGQAEDCVTLSLGYGRTAIGAVGRDVGADVGKLRRTAALWATTATLHPTGGRAALATTQDQQNMAGRDIVRSRALAEAGEKH